MGGSASMFTCVFILLETHPRIGFDFVSSPIFLQPRFSLSLFLRSLLASVGLVGFIIIGAGDVKVLIYRFQSACPASGEDLHTHPREPLAQRKTVTSLFTMSSPTFLPFSPSQVPGAVVRHYH